MTTMPFWVAASLVSDSEPPLDFQVSLEDMVSSTGRLVDGNLSQYSAKGTPFTRGDILFGKLRPYLAKYWLADREGTAGGDIHVYRPEAGVEPRYLSYIVGSRNFVRFAEAASKGVKMPRAEWMSLRGYPVNAHDLDTQRAIADYLDRETGEIDAMIVKMDELSETLEMRRIQEIRTTISSSQRMPIGMIVNVTLGKMLQTSPKSPTDHLKPYLRAAHVQPGGVLDFDVPYKEMWFSAKDSQTLDLRTGDAVIVEGGAGFGRAAFLDSDLAGWGFQNSIVRLRGSSSDTRYLVHALHAALEAGEIAIACNAATFAHFTAEKVESFRVPFHSPAERARIADHLDEVTSKIDAMLAKVAELKSLLIERRAALITEVVTGRKKVD